MHGAALPTWRVDVPTVADRVHGPQTEADAGQVPITADPSDGRVYHGHAARGRADLLLLLRKPESLREKICDCMTILVLEVQ